MYIIEVNELRLLLLIKITINTSITGTMTQNGLDNLMVKTASAETESVTITATVTLDEVSFT